MNLAAVDLAIVDLGSRMSLATVGLVAPGESQSFVTLWASYQAIGIISPLGPCSFVTLCAS